MSAVTAITEIHPPASPALHTLVWEELSRRVDAFCAAWESPDPPLDLRPFLPAEDPTIRRLVLIELIKVDLEYRWVRHDLPKHVEEYGGDFPELLEKGEFPADLIYEEFHLRSQTPAPPPAQEYYHRFPGQEALLRKLIGGETNQTISTLASGRRDPRFEPGEQIDDFDLLLKLGQGAFAGVYLARQRSMQRIVALKISQDKGTESQTLAQLDHPHIVRVYDQRLIPERKLRLMYMQHIPGGTLQQVVERVRSIPPHERTGRLLLECVDAQLRDRGEDIPHESGLRQRLARMSWPQAVCWIGSRLAQALDYAHQRGVLHRDIKPANVLVAADGSPRLADFNVSFSSKVAGITPATFFGGSLAYMSPEQLEATNPQSARQPEELDGRSDIYSLAIMLWELLAGQRPFAEQALSGNWQELLSQLTEMRQRGIPPEQWRQLPAPLPAGLAELLSQCLAPAADQRPATAATLARELELCLQPAARQLFHPRTTGWPNFAQWGRSYPLLLVVLAGLIPNVLLSVLNIIFNLGTVASNYLSFAEFARTIIYPVNGLAYPWGIGLGLWLVWPVITAVSQRRQVAFRPVDALTPPLAPFLPARCLNLGLWIALIVFALWCVSGVAIPILLSRAVEAPQVVPWSSRGLLFGSQLLFGAMSATQVYFLLTWLCLRSFYPVLVPPGGGTLSDQEHLLATERVASRMFFVTLATPFLALACLPLTGTPTDQHFTGVFVVITVFGFVSLALSYFFQRTLQQDIQVLLQTQAPGGGSSWSVGLGDSFFTGSR
ncbi:MAG: serine/threonine-protein kinase [Pirellulales bacterium]|nr:serine/threonine-protein kinase [Pirellulales bacterium]